MLSMKGEMRSGNFCHWLGDIHGEIHYISKKTMEKQNISITDIAIMQKEICMQFGIELPENFISENIDLPFDNFLRDCIQNKDGEKVLKSKLFVEYEKYCIENMFVPYGKHTFNQKMRDRGYIEYRSNCCCWKNIKLKER